MPHTFEFCLPMMGAKVPASPEWLHEIKYDGYRLRVERDGDRVRLITRNGYDWTKRYANARRELIKALGELDRPLQLAGPSRRRLKLVLVR